MFKVKTVRLGSLVFGSVGCVFLVSHGNCVKNDAKGGRMTRTHGMFCSYCNLPRSVDFLSCFSFNSQDCHLLSPRCVQILPADQRLWLVSGELGFGPWKPKPARSVGRKHQCQPSKNSRLQHSCRNSSLAWRNRRQYTLRPFGNTWDIGSDSPEKWLNTDTNCHVLGSWCPWHFWCFWIDCESTLMWTDCR